MITLQLCSCVTVILLFSAFILDSVSVPLSASSPDKPAVQ